MIIRISGSGDRIWYRIWVCLRLQWEKAGPSRGRDYLGRWSRPRPFLAAHLAFLCVYSDKKAGPSRGRARPFLHCKRGLGERMSQWHHSLSRSPAVPRYFTIASQSCLRHCAVRKINSVMRHCLKGYMNSKRTHDSTLLVLNSLIWRYKMT